MPSLYARDPAAVVGRREYSSLIRKAEV